MLEYSPIEEVPKLCPIHDYIASAKGIKHLKQFLMVILILQMHKRIAKTWLELNT